MEAGGGSTGGPSRVGALEPPPAPRRPRVRPRIYSGAGRSFLLGRPGAAPPPPGHPGVPAARGQAPAGPSAGPPPRPSQERSPARASNVSLAANDPRGPPPGQLRSPAFPAAPGSRDRGIGTPRRAGKGGQGLHPEGTAGRAAPSPAAPAGGKRSALATCPFSGEGVLPTVTVQSFSPGLGVRDFFFFNKNHF